MVCAVHVYSVSLCSRQETYIAKAPMPDAEDQSMMGRFVRVERQVRHLAHFTAPCDTQHFICSNSNGVTIQCVCCWSSVCLRWRTWRRSWTSWWTCTSSTLSTCRWTLPVPPTWPWRAASLQGTVRSGGSSSTTLRHSRTCRTRCLSTRGICTAAEEEELVRDRGLLVEATHLQTINPWHHTSTNATLRPPSPPTPSVPQCCPSALCRTCQWGWAGPQGGGGATRHSPCCLWTTRSWSARPAGSASLGSGRGKKERTCRWGPGWRLGTPAGRDPDRATWRRVRRTRTRTLLHPAGGPCRSPPRGRDLVTLCGTRRPERCSCEHTEIHNSESRP